MKDRPGLPKPPLVKDGLADADVEAHGRRAYDAGRKRGQLEERGDLIDRLEGEAARAERVSRNAAVVREFLTGGDLSVIDYDYDSGKPDLDDFEEYE